MTAVVDLAAVRRARDGLADLVEAHPYLTTPEAQERLEAWLEEEQMAREKEILDASLFLRVTPEDIRRIDALPLLARAARAARVVGDLDRAQRLLARPEAAAARFDLRPASPTVRAIASAREAQPHARIAQPREVDDRGGWALAR